MNNNSSKILVVAAGLLLSLFVILQVISSGRNALGEAYRFFLPMAFFIGFLAPRFSCYLLVIFGLYIDVGKKLLVVGEGFYFSDLFFILGTPAVMLLGACIARAINLFFNWGAPGTKRQRESFFVACILIAAISSLVLLRSGVNVTTLKALANSAAYLGLIFLIPAIFSDKNDLLRFVRFVILAAVPAALYGMYHFFFGLNDFEQIYYSSGISLNDVFVLQGEGIFGPFTSQGALSATMCMAAVFCLMTFFLNREERADYIPRWAGVILAILFLTTAVLSLKRGPLLVFPAAFVLYFLLRARIGLLAAFFAGLALIVSLAFYGETIADKLPGWQDDIDKVMGVNSQREQQFYRIRTLNVRMEEFSSLSDPSNWSPLGSLFGKGNSQLSGVTHAGIVSVIFRLGYVPILLMAAVLLPLGWKIHGIYLKLFTDGQRYAAYCICVGGALFLVPMLGFGSQTVFPVPLFIGLCMGIFALAKHLTPQRVVKDKEEGSDVIPLSNQYAN